MKDVDPSVASQALEDMQDMSFDQTLRKLAKCQLKSFFFFLDGSEDAVVMILGNRILLFDAKKVKALRLKMAGVSNPSRKLPGRGSPRLNLPLLKAVFPPLLVTVS